MHVQRQIRLPVSPEVAFAYLADLSNIFEWDPNVPEAGRVDLGPIGVGSRFRLLYRMGPATLPLDYELVAMEPGRLLVFEGRGERVRLTDRLHLSADGDGTQLTYEAQVEPRPALGAAVLGAAALRPFMERVADQVARRLAEVFGPATAADDAPDAGLNLANLAWRFTTPGWNAARARFRATPAPAPGFRVVITGVTSGLGRSAAWTLAGKGCDLVLVGRSPERLDQVASELVEAGATGQLEVRVCDLADLDAVRALGDALATDSRPVHALINNAGALHDEARTLAGLERTTVVDAVAPALLARLLRPCLREAGGAVVNVVSGGLYGVRLDVGALVEPPRPFSGVNAYAQAKRALLLETARLDAAWAGEGIRVHAMHPGWADTPGVRSSLPRFHRVTRPWLRTPFAGVDTAVWLALTNPSPGGRLWFDRRPAPEHLLARTRETDDDRARLADLFDRACG